jgi:hypothetical protein
MRVDRMPGKTLSSTASRRDLAALAVTVGVFGVVYALFARLALHAFPFSGDEYSYLLQAELFAHGQLHAPTPLHAEFLRVDHVILEPWVCSKYPPGASALLALGVRSGAAWLVTPVEGTVALVAMAAATRRVLGARDAWVAVAMLGAAPLFAFQAASFFSHTAATMWLAIAFAAVAAWSCDGKGGRMVLAGAAIGCALLTRPLDAVLFAIALLSLGSFRAVALAAAGAAPFAVLHCAYQAAQFGGPFVDGYQLYEPTFRAIYDQRTAASPLSFGHLVDREQLWQHLDILRAFLVDWTVPGAALLAVVGWVALREDPRARAVRRFATTLGILFVAALFVTVGGVDDGARPRYLSIVLVPLAFFAGPGWRAAASLVGPPGSRVRRFVVVIVWTLPALQLGAFLFERTPEIAAREGLEKAVAAKGIEEGVVVIRAAYPSRFARNGPSFDRPVLYVSAPATTSADEVAAAFPGRTVYQARQGREWTVERVR